MIDCTLLITAFERRHTLPFLLSTLRESRFPILLVDSSRQPYSDIKHYPWISYLHFPEKNIYQALYDAANIATTNYVCWNNDDDLIFAGAIEQCYHYISQNKNCSNVLGLQSKKGSNYGYNEYDHWCQFDEAEANYLDRLNNMFEVFATPVHAVVQKEVIMQSTALVLEHPRLYPIRFFDRIFGIVCAIYGYKKVLPIHYMLRSNDRLINNRDYPSILQRDTPAANLLGILKTDDPISMLASEKAGFEYQMCHTRLLNVLTEYFKTRGQR